MVSQGRLLSLTRLKKYNLQTKSVRALYLCVRVPFTQVLQSSVKL